VLHREETPAPPIDIDYVILDDGSTLWGLPLNSGGVLACTLRRVSDGRSSHGRSD
jgi:hypothetical protein